MCDLNMEGYKNIFYWSGGKDSTAALIKAGAVGVRVDEIVMCEIMFDKQQGISGELPEHIEWVYKTAIPRLEQMFNVKVTVVRGDRDYLDIFNRVVKRSSVPSRNGKKAGFLLSGMCEMNRQKTAPLRKWEREYMKANAGAVNVFMGIAKDEPIRLNRLYSKGENYYSLLDILDITESGASRICVEAGLLSPAYEYGEGRSARQGCWFCPNGYKRLRELNKRHPELVARLVELSHEPGLVCSNFIYGHKIEEFL